MEFDFRGKTAIVTGGANGMGLATARILARQGARVWLFDLDRENPADAASALGGLGIAVDVTDSSALRTAFSVVPAPDVVIANAGVAANAELTATSIETWNKTIAVNLTGIFNTVQCAAWRMKPHRSGAIVITASTNSFDGEANLIAYNASKAGLLGILHTAANELGPFRIRVNAVCPGLIRTRLTEDYFSNPDCLKDYFRAIPLGRGGEAEEVANAMAFLASDLASYITGAALLVDGGQMCTKFATWNEDRAEFANGRWKLLPEA
ncbi:MAG: SDR family oxidoreductase [Acidobacteriota bacterium]|nr:SDR family oxidoreductase [Acidobacteriota bacterium]